MNRTNNIKQAAIKHPRKPIVTVKLTRSAKQHNSIAIKINVKAIIKSKSDKL